MPLGVTQKNGSTAKAKGSVKKTAAVKKEDAGEKIASEYDKLEYVAPLPDESDEVSGGKDKETGKAAQKISNWLVAKRTCASPTEPSTISFHRPPSSVEVGSLHSKPSHVWGICHVGSDGMR